MKNFNSKYYVFIISGGRTGTRFLGNLLQSVIEKSYSVHEPDVLVFKRGYSIIYKLRIFGFYHMLFGKLLGKTGIRNLSQKYLYNKLSLSQLEKEIIKQRKKYYENIDFDLIIESYYGWYGCIPAIRRVFKNYKIIIVSRDPRDWVSSNMNWGTLFGYRDWVSRLGFNRLNPWDMNDADYMNVWRNFSTFEKICWTYKTQYECMINSINGDPNIKLIQFEDLFISQHKYYNFNDLLSFITSYSDKQFKYHLPNNLLDTVIHKNISDKFPNYQEWDINHVKRFNNICNSIMQRLGYTW